MGPVVPDRASRARAPHRPVRALVGRSALVRPGRHRAPYTQRLGGSSPLRQRARRRVRRRDGGRARRAVAQLVESRSPKPAVGGSSPSGPAASAAVRLCGDQHDAAPEERTTDRDQEEAVSRDAGDRRRRSSTAIASRRASIQPLAVALRAVPPPGHRRAAQGHLADPQGADDLHLVVIVFVLVVIGLRHRPGLGVLSAGSPRDLRLTARLTA